MSSDFPLLEYAETLQSGLKPRRRHKKAVEGRRVAEASLEAYERVKKARSGLYRPILKLLSHRGSDPLQCPTAREILAELKAQGILPQNAERNAVSPRCSELLDAGCIEQPDYIKTVPGQAAAGVWRITDKGRELLKIAACPKQANS
jgi:hypothetical protein